MTRLGELERKVMDVLWDSMEAELTVRQIAAELPDRAYTTVLTVLDRLRRKHMVRRIEDRKAHHYAAAASRETFTAKLMNEALGTAVDRDAVLVHFAGEMNQADADSLQHALLHRRTRSPGIDMQ